MNLITSPILRLMSSSKGQVLTGQIAADLYIDCRVMINPHRDQEIGHLTGDHPAVQQWIVENNQPFIDAVLALIALGLNTASSRNSFKRAGDVVVPGDYPTSGKPFTVCFFCLAGVHRSRGTKHVVAKYLKAQGLEVEVLGA